MSALHKIDSKLMVCIGSCAFLFLLIAGCGTSGQGEQTSDAIDTCRSALPALNAGRSQQAILTDLMSEPYSPQNFRDPAVTEAYNQLVGASGGAAVFCSYQVGDGAPSGPTCPDGSPRQPTIVEAVVGGGGKYVLVKRAECAQPPS